MVHPSGKELNEIVSFRFATWFGCERISSAEIARRHAKNARMRINKPKIKDFSKHRIFGYPFGQGPVLSGKVRPEKLLIDAINQTGRNCALEIPRSMHYFANHNAIQPRPIRRI
ncbi:hypothetical protein OVA07_13035 [Novosphingobium sp. SL115]|uniref:hypothetical protein n=1 Tax=Novosphingobium sp. SL115 TaxID=2995150 RepID=UPI002276ABCF|nr:hypothetical protein [Novosphingobium sp. SL115]MCY1671926.1 hypothetical protein [Novosphingobium sp. SL115]